jgi:hypothetical protein
VVVLHDSEGGCDQRAEYRCVEGEFGKGKGAGVVAEAVGRERLVGAAGEAGVEFAGELLGALADCEADFEMVAEEEEELVVLVLPYLCGSGCDSVRMD